MNMQCYHIYSWQRDSTESQCPVLHATKQHRTQYEHTHENSHGCMRLKFKGKENMANENNTSIDSAATSYLRDNNDRDVTTLPSDSAQYKQTDLPLTIRCSASILSDVKLVTTVFSCYEQKPNTHPVKYLVFLGIFLVFGGVENRAHVFSFRRRREMFFYERRQLFPLVWHSC